MSQSIRPDEGRMIGEGREALLITNTSMSDSFAGGGNRGLPEKKLLEQETHSRTSMTERYDDDLDAFIVPRGVSSGSHHKDVSLHDASWPAAKGDGILRPTKRFGLVRDEVYDRAAAAAHAERDSIVASPKSPSGSMGEDDLSWSPQSGIDIHEQEREKKKTSFGFAEQRSQGVSKKIDSNVGSDKYAWNASPSQALPSSGKRSGLASTGANVLGGALTVPREMSLQSEVGGEARYLSLRGRETGVRMEDTQNFFFSQFGQGGAAEGHENDEKGDSDVGKGTYEYRKGMGVEPSGSHNKDESEPSNLEHDEISYLTIEGGNVTKRAQQAFAKLITFMPNAATALDDEYGGVLAAIEKGDRVAEIAALKQRVSLLETGLAEDDTRQFTIGDQSEHSVDNNSASQVAEKKGLHEKNRKFAGENIEYDGAHHGLLQALTDRGAVEGIIEDSWDVKRAHVGIVVHDEPQRLLDFLLEESKAGIFRRETLHVEGNRAFVFWLHYIKGGTTAIEYLLNIKVGSEEDSSCHTVELKSLLEKELPKGALKKLQTVRKGIHRVQRAKVDGALKMQDFEHGQTALTFVGSLEAEEVEELEEDGTTFQNIEEKKGHLARAKIKAKKLGKKAKSF